MDADQRDQPLVKKADFFDPRDLADKVIRSVGAALAVDGRQIV